MFSEVDRQEGRGKHMNFNNVLSKVVRLQGVCVCVFFYSEKRQ